MKNKKQDQKKGRLERGIAILVTVLLVLSVLLCVYVVAQILANGYVSFGGYMLFRVVTGSMEPAIPVGSLLVSQQVELPAVAVGDIICFRTQDATIWGRIVTHRVVGILQGVDGSLLMETKGDANLVADAHYVTRDNFIGKVVWYTGENSFLVRLIAFLTGKIGFMACIALPCLLFSGLILRESVVGIRRELEAYKKEVHRLEVMEMQWQARHGLTQEEYDEMNRRIRAELREEMKQLVEILREESIS